MMKKRLFSSFMTILLGAMLLNSCVNDQTDAPSKVTDDDTEAQTEVQTLNAYGDTLPDGLDFGGKAFRVATYDGGNLTHEGGWYNYIDVNETNGDVLNDAAFLRNEEVEARLNVNIECHEIGDRDNATSVFVRSITAGDDAYDIYLGGSHVTYTAMISSNMLYDTSDLRYMDLSQPYYTKSSYETYELNGHRYLFSGAYTYPLYSGVYWLFNTKMWADLNLPDAYQTVRDGKWTHDLALSYIKGTYSDVNGDSKKDIEDRYGITTVSEMMCYLYAGMGMKGVIPTDDGFDYDYEDEKAVKVLENLIEWVAADDAYVNDSIPWKNFFDGNSLMMFYGSSLPRLRDLPFDFGFLPMPKYDEEQENYISYMCGGLVCVPVTITDTDCVGATVEALFSASERYLKPAYIDKFVENKILRDEGSVEMYNLILKTATYDFCRYISPSAAVENYKIIHTLVENKSTDLASQWAKIEKQVKAAFEDFYDEFMSGES